MARPKNLRPRLYRHRGIYHLDFYHPVTMQRQKLSTSTSDPVEAERLRQAKEDECGATRLGYTRMPLPGQVHVTVGQCLDLLPRDYARKGNTSWDTMQYHATRARESFGPRRALDLTMGDVQDAIDDWLADDVKPATVNNRLAMLFRGLEVAVERKMLPMMPDCRVDPLEPHNAKEGWVEQGVYDALRVTLPDDDLRDVCEWGYFCGWRKGEVQALTWAALDPEAWELRLHARDDKARKGRVIPIVDLPGIPLRTMLKRRMKARVLGCPYIFHRKGAQLGDFDKAWATAWAEAGLELVTRPIRPRTPEERQHPRMATVPARTYHDFRRTAVRNLALAGVPRKIAKCIVGHRTDHIYDRYFITEAHDVVEAFGQLGRYHLHLRQARTP
jgi:integrase